MVSSQSVSQDKVSLGLDPTDPFAKEPRACTLAILDSSFQCTFTDWNYSLAGEGLLPSAAKGKQFILAIDGPQGLAGKAGARMRDCERALSTPGKSPYDFPERHVPFAGFIQGSVKLFHNLYEDSSRFRIAAVRGNAAENANLIEIYPGKAWPILNGGKPLKKKSSPLGLQERHRLLVARGIIFPPKFRFTHDHLDAALCAWIAYLFSRQQVQLIGEPPNEDQEAHVLREGYIVQPNS